jgi:hypothetical protein
MQRIANAIKIEGEAGPEELSRINLSPSPSPPPLPPLVAASSVDETAAERRLTSFERVLMSLRAVSKLLVMT